MGLVDRPPAHRMSYPAEDAVSTSSSASNDDSCTPTVTRIMAKGRDCSPNPHLNVSGCSSSDVDISDCSSVDSYGLQKDRSSNNGVGSIKDEWNIVKSAHISNEYVRLSELLDHMQPQQVVDVLRKRLRKRDSKAIVALSVLLPRSKFPPIENLHCVRCHKSFDPQENSHCVIRHPNTSVIKRKEDAHGATFHCRACSCDFHLAHMYFYNESVNSYLTGFCFSGKHTTNTRLVEFQGAIKTCEENGCVEFYV